MAPYLMVAAADARHFQELTEDVYRFMPFRLSPNDLEGIHGTNERVSVKGLAEAVGFYVQLIRNAVG